ncbi:MAG: cell division protein ZapA [Elusimicrobia bacterium]|nr:cell division protein ZapA [Elusimicrobiota bacterium]MDE2236678.1 cell division protein ZapA [Elusimicrobiota bacterium]MDE2425070.1 cell division protein ZapA [Elusimicrobiota bacterium]
MNDKVDIQVFRRRLSVEMEGLTQLEINALAQKVHEKMTEISEENNKLADSSLLAILAALHFAAELEQERRKSAMEQNILERKLEAMAQPLRAALTHVDAS